MFMKKSLICLFLAVALFGCSKSDDSPTPTPTPTTPVAADVIKLYNKDTSAEIKDGDVLTFNSISPRDGVNNILKFYFKNLTSNPIKVKGKIVSITGTPNGSYGQFCIGAQCYNPIVVGTSYPPQGDPVVDIPANGTAGTDGAYKFYNEAAPTAPATKIDYVFEFYQYDSSNNVVGKTIKITYRHQP